MTEEEKKDVYDKGYAHWLEFHKNEFSRYEHYLKIPLEQRWEIMFHVKAIWNIMASCGVHMYSETSKPMSDVADMQLQFKTEGDPSTLKDLLISSHDSCWSTVVFEQTPEEIERAARSSAKMEVEMAEYREQKKKEEEEQHKRDEEAWAKHLANEKEAEKKAKKEMEEWEAKMKAEKEELEKWYEGVREKLEGMRHGHYDWSITDHFDAADVNYIRNYAWKLFAFTDAQNLGMSGLGLYQQNEDRTAAHEDMLEHLGLSGNKYAVHITKSYDFADDYDPRTEQYKHLDEDVVVDMLGYALLEAEMHETEKKDSELKDKE